MAHVDPPSGLGATESRAFDEWLRDPRHFQSAEAIDECWREGFKSLIFRHIDVSLQQLTRARRVHAWLRWLASGSAVLACIVGSVWFTLVPLETALAAASGSFVLPDALPSRSVVITSAGVASFLALVFIRLHRIVHTSVTAHQRELENAEARYLAYASAVVIGQKNLLGRVTEAMSSEPDPDPDRDRHCEMKESFAPGPTGRLMERLLRTVLSRSARPGSRVSKQRDP